MFNICEIYALERKFRSEKWGLKMAHTQYAHMEVRPPPPGCESCILTHNSQLEYTGSSVVSGIPGYTSYSVGTQHHRARLTVTGYVWCDTAVVHSRHCPINNAVGRKLFRVYNVVLGTLGELRSFNV